MAITTLDGLIAGFQQPYYVMKHGTTMELAGTPHSMFYAPGTPGPGSVPSPGLNGEALTSVTGQIPFDNPTGGELAYLARWQSGVAGVAGQLWLCDRLWQNSGFTSTQTTAHSITSAALPARDRNGSTNGEDVMFALELSTASTNGAAVTNTTMSYVNSTATGGTRTATIPSFPASAVAGTFVPFALQSGDRGVRSVSEITLGTSYGTAVIHLVGFRVLARMAMIGSNSTRDIDAITGGLPRLYDNTCPFLVYVPNATTATTLIGSIAYAHG